jgi:broad specificity phosphatase PhoE
MAEAKLDRIYCSPLMRAIETAQPLARATGLTAEVWLDAHELWTGEGYRGPTTERLAEMYPEIRFAEGTAADPLGWHCPGGETSQSGFERAQMLLERIRSRCGADERVALVAHGALNRRLMLVVLGLDCTSNLRPYGANCSVWWLGLEGNRTAVRYVGPAIPQLFQIVH